MKKVLLFIFLLCLAAFVTTLFVISPGRLKSFVDQNGRDIPGSISVEVFIEVGGVKQGMFIKYLEKLQAPINGFYTFKESAHSPIFEEPQTLKEILIMDVLNRSANLADN